jgi:hypothetical protein
MRNITADVAIVGAGPGGLTAAHAIIAASPHLKVWCVVCGVGVVCARLTAVLTCTCAPLQTSPTYRPPRTAPPSQVMVFERSAADLRTTHRGAGLGLDVNGQKALKAIKPGVVGRAGERREPGLTCGACVSYASW